jgi:hypothetical protein
MTNSLAPKFTEADEIKEGPPLKECPKARRYEVHPPHPWHRPNRARWPFHCDGILPVDQQPPCQIYISPQQPECGEPAPTYVRIKNQALKQEAIINICAMHKSVHDQQAAARRAAHQAAAKLRKAS